jgi:hypothetical protein
MKIGLQNLSSNISYTKKHVKTLRPYQTGFFMPSITMIPSAVKTPLYRPISNPNIRHFYVCSYGGCGSFMLCDYLKNFGKVEHVHSREPPSILSGITNEWFNGKPIIGEAIKKYTVIYIYKNPIKAIYSRYIKTIKNNNKTITGVAHKEHQHNVQCDREDITVEQCINENKDLFKIEEFFDNYTTLNKRKNYFIYCVKYEDFWQNISEFNKTFRLQDRKDLYPEKKETKRNYVVPDKLLEIYTPLIEKMKTKKFIEIV